MKELLSKFVPTAIVLAIALFGGSLVFAQSNDSAQINELLQQAKTRAVQANFDAELISSFTRSGTSWRSHANQLASMKEHINAMGKMLAEMDAARAEGSPWQQEAIDEVEPMLRSMADHLSTMIDHLNEHPDKVHLPTYVNYANANLRLSEKLLAMIKDYVDYSEAKATADKLEQKLELPEVASEQ
jgi:hypothetical protein